jgi:hypothetical protein
MRKKVKEKLSRWQEVAVLHEGVLHEGVLGVVPEGHLHPGITITAGGQLHRRGRPVGEKVPLRVFQLEEGEVI